MTQRGNALNFRDFVEHLRRDGQQPDERGAGSPAEHDLEAALEREHLGIEAGRRDHVRQEVLDVVERARLTERVREREDLLLEEELLLVVEHAAERSRRRSAHGPSGLASRILSRSWIPERRST